MLDVLVFDGSGKVGERFGMVPSIKELAKKQLMKINKHIERYISCYCKIYHVKPEEFDKYELVYKFSETGEHSVWMKQKTISSEVCGDPDGIPEDDSSEVLQDRIMRAVNILLDTGVEPSSLDTVHHW